MNTTEQQTMQSIYPALRYDDSDRAIAWLTSVLGFEEQVVYRSPDGRVQHAELKLGGNLIMLGPPSKELDVKSPLALGSSTSSIYIALESAAEIDARYGRAKDAGARIARELCDTDYGSHEFSVRDPEGHHWTFGTYRPQAT